MADRLVRWLGKDGVDLGFLPINPTPPGPLAVAEKIKFLQTAVVSAIYCLSLMRRVRCYDLVHLFSASHGSFLISQMPAILIARLYGKPVILNYRSGEARDHLARAGRVVFGLLRMCVRIVVPSAYLVGVFAEFALEAEAIANVVDSTELRARERCNAQPRLIVPRTLEAHYDVSCAIRAFHLVKQRCPDATLTILGEGSEEAKLRDLADELQLRDIYFAGRIARSEIGQCYDQHDILLNTSCVDNMPVSLLEGFAAGLPIVTTDAGGIPFLVRDRDNGHLVPVGDYRALAERVLELVEGPGEMKRFSGASLAESRRYSWGEVGSQWRDLYAQVARAQTASGAEQGE
jgi:glycosyltransferase involved in cell wall biosynthesis